MPPRTAPLDRVRALCLALPQATELRSHGEPCFRTPKRLFAMWASADTHHGKGRDALWIRSTLGVQSALVAERPAHLFIPPYVGHQGWVGVWLDGRVNWSLVRDLIEEGHRLSMVTTKRAPRPLPRL